MLRDPKLLNMFRELLVIFRIWGLIRHSCLPTFSYMENVDVIATLFRILTRLLQTSEPDESLLGMLFLVELIVFHFTSNN
jgi:mediator of RNA polymerase II transcription subunit 16